RCALKQAFKWRGFHPCSLPPFLVFPSPGLRELLKDLPARDSVRLRSELAMATRDAQRQLHAINKTTVHVARLGIPI
ncbi:unnamed protein product, partial [Closterium sp. NIES-54]